MAHLATTALLALSLRCSGVILAARAVPPFCPPLRPVLLKTAIKEETQKLSDKVDDSQKTVLEKVEDLFNRKFYQAVGVIVGCLSVMFGRLTFLRDHGITGTALGWVAIIGGLGIFLLIFLLSRKTHQEKPATHS